MAKVTLYEATDGSLHKTSRLCEAHNVTLRILASVSANDFDFSVGYTPDGQEPPYSVIDADSLPSFIAANASELRKLLNDALTAKRPRKPKAGPTPQQQAFDERKAVPA